MEIINVTRDLIPQIELIEKSCFSAPWTAAQLSMQLDENRHIFLAAAEDGRVLGYMGLMFVLDEGYISNVAVAAQHRRRGIAAALIEEMIKRARERCLAFLTLEVRQSNVGARRLYEKLGFENVGTRRGYYANPKEDAIISSLFLSY